MVVIRCFATGFLIVWMCFPIALLFFHIVNVG